MTSISRIIIENGLAPSILIPRFLSVINNLCLEVHNKRIQRFCSYFKKYKFSINFHPVTYNPVIICYNVKKRWLLCNKDILFKILCQTYKEKSFAAYGINLPPIQELLPTNLPKISANEKDIDNLFLLKDGTYVIVDYEAEFREVNKIKYLNYISRVMEKYYRENKNFRLRLVVIYTGDVRSAEPDFETDCITIRTEQAFLTHIDGEAAYSSISQKIHSVNNLKMMT